MKKATADRRSETRSRTHTLAIDIGGTGIKASVLDGGGRMTAKRVRVETPYPCRPETLLRVAAEMTKSLPAFDRISIGFPGVIRRGRVVTAPHFGTKRWRGYPLEEALSRRLGKPARLLNDAEVQGLGVIAGRGLEVVMTLGTGVGTAVFADGRLTPHLELAHHPIHKDMTYDDYLGNAALHAHKVRKWSRRVLKAIGFIHTLLNYDTLYIGGGNAAKIRGDLPDNVKICPNSAGITGGVHLWDGDLRI